jgi:uncharacterized membrane protein
MSALRHRKQLLMAVAIAGALATPKVLPADAHADSSRLLCQGNEPSWKLSIEGGQAKFSRPVDGLGAAEFILSGSLTGPLPDHPGQIVWRGRSEGAGSDLVAFATEAQCRDTGAESKDETVYPWEATLSLPTGELLVGCCQAPAATAEAPPAPKPWWERLTELRPAMEACLRQTTGTDPRVTKAWAMDDGRVGVRTRNLYGGWWECVATADGNAVASFEPLPPDGSGLPGEAVVIYTPVRNGNPPFGACYQFHEPVHDDAGNVVGWLSHLIC